MAEEGSDKQFARIANVSEIMELANAEEQALSDEQKRVAAQTPLDDPGQQHKAPDYSDADDPKAKEPAPDYDTNPPPDQSGIEVEAT